MTKTLLKEMAMTHLRNTLATGMVIAFVFVSAFHCLAQTTPTKSDTFAPDRIIVKYKKNALSPLPSAMAASAQDGKEVSIKHFRGSRSIDNLHKKHHVKGMRKMFRKNKTSFAPGAARFAASNKTSPADELADQDIYIVEMSTKNDVKNAVEDFKKDPNVEYAQPDYIVKANFLPNDPYFQSRGTWGQNYDDLWGLKRINAPQAWDTAQGQGVVVAVVDTGIDYNHPDIAANIVPGWNFVNNTANAWDDNGHGTHVSGTIAAIGNNNLGIIGVAPQAKIMPIKALDLLGSGYTSDLANGIVYAAQHGAKVINNSWGCSDCPSSPVAEDAVRTATDLGCVVVFAAGNESVNVANQSPQNMTDHKPLVVAASQPDDNLAYFSNFGDLVDVTAPGSGSSTYVNGILSLKSNTCFLCSSAIIVNSKYLRIAGTSMAAPHVSGLAALILSAGRNFTNEEVKTIIKSTADHNPNLPGKGLINAAEALKIIDIVTSKIDSPSNIMLLKDQPMVQIKGTAIAKQSFKNYILAYSSIKTPSTWTTISSGTSPINGGTLGTWNISLLKPDIYRLRLQAWNTSQPLLPMEDYVVVSVADSNVKRISTTLPESMAIEGDDVVWQDSASAKTYLYNIKTQKTVEIPVAYDGSTLYLKNGLVVGRTSAEGTITFKIYDPKNLSTRTVSPAKESSILDVNNNKIFYLTFDPRDPNNPYETLKSEIFFYDINTSSTSKLNIDKNLFAFRDLVADGNNLYCLLSDRTIAYGPYQIYKYDLTNNTLALLPPAIRSLGTIIDVTSNHLILQGQNEIYLISKDLLTVNKITDTGNPYSILASDSKLVWVDTINNINSIKVYDFIYGYEEPAASLPGFKGSLNLRALNGNTLAWRDPQGIYIYTFPSPNPIFQSLNPIYLRSGETLSFQVKATDPHAQKITFSVTGYGSTALNTYMPGAVFKDNGDGTANITWAAPANAISKEYILDFTATNAKGAQSSMQVRVKLQGPTVKGNLDALKPNGDGSYSLTGWACTTTLNQSINVHLYIGGALGVPKVFYGAANANLPSEPAVAQACEASGTNYRFNLKIAASAINAYPGQPIHAYGISPIGGTNNELQNFGYLSIPSVPYLMGSAYSNDVYLPSWSANAVIDGNASTSYSSAMASSSTNTKGSSLAVWLKDAPKNVNRIILTARIYNGQVQAFPTSYDIYLTSPDNTRWDYVGTYSNQPDASGKAVIILPKWYSTHGVVITPRTLGKDSYGNYYFQMAEVQLSL